jgi:hypothetical protein
MGKASEEKLEIEQEISHLQYGIFRSNEVLKSVNKELGKAQARKEIAEEKIKHHSKNLLHMRKRADIINLDEYLHTMKAVEDAEGELDDARRQYAIEKSKSDGLLEAIQRAELEILKLRLRLEQYGKIIFTCVI